MTKLADKRTCAAGFFAGLGTIFGTTLAVWGLPLLGWSLGVLWIVAGLAGLYLHVKNDVYARIHRDEAGRIFDPSKT